MEQPCPYLSPHRPAHQPRRRLGSSELDNLAGLFGFDMTARLHLEVLIATLAIATLALSW